MKWLYDRFGVYIEDFRFQPEEQMVETEEPLSAKRWGALKLRQLHLLWLCLVGTRCHVNSVASVPQADGEHETAQ